MARQSYITKTAVVHFQRHELRVIFENLNDKHLIDRLTEYRRNGRPGYPVRAMWRSYVASFVLNLANTNDLIRRLYADAELRRLCGFKGVLPHRTTFNRFIQRLSHNSDLVEQAFAGVTERLKGLLTDLGQEVAVDSSTVRTHANPNRRTISDPEASWTAKNSVRAKEGGKEWRYGYKLHMVADANHGIPMGVQVTTAKRNDSPELPPLMEKAKATIPWFTPKVAMADKGYDGMPNYRYLVDNGITPVILKKRGINSDLYGGIYTEEGIPICMGKLPMQYVRSDPKRGHLYQCRGCHLKDSTKGGIRHCDSEVWEDPSRDIRLFGVLRRDSPEWKALYGKRQAIERIFKSLKQSRRLERHCVRGLRQITLHCLMSVLVYQATVLTHVQNGEVANIRWQVLKVA